MGKIKFIIVLLMLCSSLVYAESDSTRTVTVVGLSSTEIMADNVAWYLNVLVKDEDQKKLRARADEIISQVKTAGETLSLELTDIEYNKVTINIRYKRKNHQESDEISHYDLSQSIVIYQYDINRYDEFWQVLTAIPGVRVNQRFYTSKLEETRQQVRLDAIKSAQQKANEYAEIVGSKLGKAISISEFRPNTSQSHMEQVSAVQGSFSRNSPEKIEISARVYVVFELL